MSPPAAPPAFNGFDVARQAWELLIGHRGVLLVAGAVGVILLVLPGILTFAVALVAMPFALVSTSAEPAMPFVLGVLVAGGFVAGLLFVVGAAMAAQIVAVTRAAEGLHVNVADALTAAYRAAPRLILLTFTIAIVVFTGFMLFIVPGFIAIACLFVAIPASVLEGHGVVASLRRSLELTRGRRWRLFSTWFGIGLVVSIFAAMVEAILRALGFGLTFTLLQIVFFVAWNAWNANYVGLAFLRLRDGPGAISAPGPR